MRSASPRNPPTTKVMVRDDSLETFSKKEASECRLWLRLLAATSQDEQLAQVLHTLHKEADELARILATILRNSQS